MKRKDAKKWRSAIDRHDLYFDRMRREQFSIAARYGNCRRADDALDWWESQTMGALQSELRVSCPVGVSLVDYVIHILDVTERTAGTRDGIEKWYQLDGVQIALSYVAGFLLEMLYASRKTKLFVSDYELIRDVVKSANEPVGGEDLDRLPADQMFVEFDEPVEFAKGPNRYLKALGVALVNLGETPLRAVVVVSDLKVPIRVNDDGTARLIGANASLFLVYWRGELVMSTADQELSDYLGSVDGRQDDPEWAEMTRRAAVSVRNVYDFLTSRSFDYVEQRRRTCDYSKLRGFQHLQGGMAQGVRDYKLVKLNKGVERRLPGGMSPQRVGGEISVEIPGCFHRWVYCRSCGDCHRHDLIGSPCRKCGVRVGPTANLRVERYWHPPHVRGEGPLKDYVRHMVT